MITYIKRTKNFCANEILFSDNKYYKEIDLRWTTSHRVGSTNAFNFDEFIHYTWDTKNRITTILPIIGYYYIHPYIYLSLTGDIIAMKVYQDGQEYLLVNSYFETVSPRQYKQLLKNIDKINIPKERVIIGTNELIRKTYQEIFIPDFKDYSKQRKEEISTGFLNYVKQSINK